MMYKTEGAREGVREEATPLTGSRPPLTVRLQPAGICSVVSLFLLGMGAYYAVTGAQAAATAAETDPSVAFQSLGVSCVMTGVQHSFRSVRESISNNGGSGGETYDICEDSRIFSFQYENQTHVEAPISNRRAATMTTIDSSLPLSSANDVCHGATHGWDGPWCTGDPAAPGNAISGDSGAHHNPRATRDCPAPAPGTGPGAVVACWRPAVPCVNRAGGGCPSWYNCGEVDCYKVIDPAWELAAHAAQGDLAGMLGYFMLFLGVICSGVACYFVRDALKE